MKILKIFGYLLGALTLLVGSAAAWIHFFTEMPTVEVNAPNITVPRDSAHVAEGKRLASMYCQHCHQSADGALSGRYMAENEPYGKNAYSANITQHPEAGIGRYTDGELVYMLRTGVKRDGKATPPWMPRLIHMSNEDLYSIVAYLRSDDPAVQPVDVRHPAFEPNFLAKFFISVIGIDPHPFPEKPIEAPPATDKVAYGRYLLHGRFDCYGCHSTSFETLDVTNPEKSPGYLAGGNPMTDSEGRTISSANLTPDPETGLGKWTEAQFAEAVRFGKHPGGRALRFPMTPFTAMTDEEVSALWAYLQTVPPAHHAVDRQLNGAEQSSQ